MSRILRRPMFRGGKVIDSRGTGITSGLMDGGRVGYQSGDIVLGGSLYSSYKILVSFQDRVIKMHYLVAPAFKTTNLGIKI